MIKVLNFSPGQERFCDHIVGTIRSEFKDCKVYNTRDMNFAACKGCYYCQKTGSCFYRDDCMQFYQELAHDDLLVMVTPIYFSNVPAKAKGLIDRSQVYYVRKKLLGLDSLSRGKVCTVIVGGDVDANISSIKETLKHFYMAISREQVLCMAFLGTDQLQLAEGTEFGHKVCKEIHKHENHSNSL